MLLAIRYTSLIRNGDLFIAIAYPPLWGDFDNLFNFSFLFFSAPSGFGLILHIDIIVGICPH
nr:MAG TPA: hypothetical protein [Caudoviricetes sp.]